MRRRQGSATSVSFYRKTSWKIMRHRNVLLVSTLILSTSAAPAQETLDGRRAIVKFGEALLLKMSGSHANVELNATKGHPGVAALAFQKLADADFKWLGKQTALTTMHLQHTNINDKWLADLKGLRNLKELNLAHTAVTAKGVPLLSNFAKLEDI